MAHIAKVAEMAQRTGKSQGEIVRDAIDLLYDRMGLDDEPSQDYKVSAPLGPGNVSDAATSRREIPGEHGGNHPAGN